MILGDRLTKHAARLRASADVNETHAAALTLRGLEEHERPAAVHVHDVRRVLHRPGVRGEGRAREHDIAVSHGVAGDALVADVTAHHAHAIGDAVEVRGVSAAAGIERIEDRDLRPDRRAAMREVRADEPEAAGHEHAAAGEALFAHRASVATAKPAIASATRSTSRTDSSGYIGSDRT